MTDTAIKTDTAPGAPFQTERRADPCVLVIFGGTGDLAKRKLLPAIYNLGARGLLPNRFAVVGYARSEMTDDEYREHHIAVAGMGFRPCHATIRSQLAFGAICGG